MIAITKGSIDQTLHFMLRDSTTGQPKTGYTIANLDLQYTRARSTPAAKVDLVALAATNTAHTDNRAIELDATSSPGVYRVDLPDAAFASGVDSVVCVVSGSGVDPASIEVSLTGFDLQTATQSVSVASGGITTASFAAGAINAAAIAADAIGASELAADAVAEIQSGLATAAAVAALPTAANNADAVWDELRADHTTSSTFGQGVASVTGSVGSVATGGITAASFSGGAINASAVGPDAIGASELAADACTEIAAAVWDKLRSAHTTAGTFGEGAASVQGNVTGSVGSVATNGITATSLAVGSIRNVNIETGAITSTAFAAGAIDNAALGSNAITASKIAPDTIGASELAADAVTEIVTALLDTATVELLTVRQALALILAAETGKTSGAATTTFTVKGADNNTTRISATVDPDGNRTAVTLTPP